METDGWQGEKEALSAILILEKAEYAKYDSKDGYVIYDNRIHRIVFRLEPVILCALLLYKKF